jgi:serine/threonine protein kinase
MQGGSLFDYLHIKGYKPSEGKIINICKKIALGMTYLHGKKIIHCDLKSSNLLLDQYEKVKISDFGLSQIKRENSKKKCRSTRLGTPHWMAP